MGFKCQAVQADLDWGWKVRIASGIPQYKGTHSSTGPLVQPGTLVVLDPKLNTRELDKTLRILEQGPNVAEI